MKRREFSAEIKSKIVIEVLKGESTVSEIASREEISSKQLHNWKKEFLENAYRAFSVTKDERASKKQAQIAIENEEELIKKVGQLTIENDWLKKKSTEIFGADYEKKFTKRPV